MKTTLAVLYLSALTASAFDFEGWTPLASPPGTGSIVSFALLGMGLLVIWFAVKR
jgi:hypothetical protein